MTSQTPLKSPFPKSVYVQNAKLYRLLANPKRLEILNAIKDREATVEEMSDLLGVRPANTSQHLTVLRRLEVVTFRRDGRNIYYKIANPRIVEPCRIFKEIREEAKNNRRADF
ncbi:MAG: metalloregulator ArsR/SmtB family transcription factor [Patescibacteria group bacterium]